MCWPHISHQSRGGHISGISYYIVFNEKLSHHSIADTARHCAGWKEAWERCTSSHGGRADKTYMESTLHESDKLKVIYFAIDMAVCASCTCSGH